MFSTPFFSRTLTRLHFQCFSYKTQYKLNIRKVIKMKSYIYETNPNLAKSRVCNECFWPLIRCSSFQLLYQWRNSRPVAQDSRPVGCSSCQLLYNWEAVDRLIKTVDWLSQTIDRLVKRFNKQCLSRTVSGWFKA